MSKKGPEGRECGPRALRADGLIDDGDDDDLGPPRLAQRALLHSGDGDVRQEAVREQVPVCVWFDLQFGSQIITRSLMGKFLPVQIVTSCLMEVLIRLDGLFGGAFFMNCIWNGFCEVI